MSMQISVDPAALSQEQREAVAGFILAYPGRACAGTCGNHAVAEIPAFIYKDTADAGLVEVGRTIAPAVNELEVLQHDHESTLPVAAFGQPVVDEAAAAFGVPPVPLGVSVPLAGSTPAIAAGAIVAPPPPVNTAPITTTPGVASSAPTTHAGGVDLDKHGLPWDGRIHAGTKRKNADGSWTAKRGVDPALVASVEAELRQVMGATGAPLVPSTAPIAPTPPLAPAAPVTANLPTASVSQPVAVPPPPVPVVGAEPTMQAAPNVAPTLDPRQMFVALVGRASAAIQAGKVTQDEINQACQAAGVPALPLLANRLDLVGTVAASVDAIIASRG